MVVQYIPDRNSRDIKRISRAITYFTLLTAIFYVSKRASVISEITEEFASDGS